MFSAAACRIAAVEFVRRQSEGFTGKSISFILHAQMQCVIRCIGAQKDSAVVRGILYGIVDQVGEDAPQFILRQREGIGQILHLEEAGEAFAFSEYFDVLR